MSLLFRYMSLLTLGAHAQVVGSVCVCALKIVYSSHKRPTNDTTYLTGNAGQKICAVFSENAPLQSYSASSSIACYC